MLCLPSHIIGRCTLCLPSYIIGRCTLCLPSLIIGRCMLCLPSHIIGRCTLSLPSYIIGRCMICLPSHKVNPTCLRVDRPLLRVLTPGAPPTAVLWPGRRRVPGSGALPPQLLDAALARLLVLVERLLARFRLRFLHPLVHGDVLDGLDGMVVFGRGRRGRRGGTLVDELHVRVDRRHVRGVLGHGRNWGTLEGVCDLGDKSQLSGGGWGGWPSVAGLEDTPPVNSTQAGTGDRGSRSASVYVCVETVAGSETPQTGPTTYMYVVRVVEK